MRARERKRHRQTEADRDQRQRHKGNFERIPMMRIRVTWLLK